MRPNATFFPRCSWTREVPRTHIRFNSQVETCCFAVALGLPSERDPFLTGFWVPMLSAALGETGQNDFPHFLQQHRAIFRRYDHFRWHLFGQTRASAAKKMRIAQLDCCLKRQDTKTNAVPQHVSLRLSWRPPPTDSKPFPFLGPKTRRSILRGGGLGVRVEHCYNLGARRGGGTNNPNLTFAGSGSTLP